MIIADFQGVTPAIGWQVIIVIIGLILLALQVATFFRSPRGQRIEPSPLEVREAPDLVGRAEFHRELEQVRSDVENARRGITELETELRKDLKKDVGDLYEKLNGIGREVSALSASIVGQNQTLAQIGAKLDRLAERQVHP